MQIEEIQTCQNTLTEEILYPYLYNWLQVKLPVKDVDNVPITFIISYPNIFASVPVFVLWISNHFWGMIYTSKILRLSSGYSC